MKYAARSLTRVPIGLRVIGRLMDVIIAGFAAIGSDRPMPTPITPMIIGTTIGRDGDITAAAGIVTTTTTTVTTMTTVATIVTNPGF